VDKALIAELEESKIIGARKPRVCEQGRDDLLALFVSVQWSRAARPLNTPRFHCRIFHLSVFSAFSALPAGAEI